MHGIPCIWEQDALPLLAGVSVRDLCVNHRLPCCIKKGFVWDEVRIDAAVKTALNVLFPDVMSAGMIPEGDKGNRMGP